MINIRPIQKTDNPVLARIIRDTFEEFKAPREGTVYSDSTTNQLYELFQAENSILWVAEQDNEVVGCCGIYPTEGLPEFCGELVKFYLANRARGNGIGKILMQKSIKAARKMGYKRIYLESMPAFQNAVRIYLKQRFRQLEKRLGDSGHISCTIWMIKEL